MNAVAIAGGPRLNPAMRRSIVITLIGADRPGLVERVAAAVADHSGNWIESRMCHLGGEFAGILRAEFPADRSGPFEEALAALSADGLSVAWKAEASAPAPSARRAARLDLLGQDRPGIVRQIAGALARAGANVEDLETECLSAPMSGETLFKATAVVALPPGCDEAALRAELERVAADLTVDVTFTPQQTP
jgi:glycine cleavage system regulatory protein